MSAMSVEVEVWWMVLLTLYAWIQVTLGTNDIDLMSGGLKVNVLLKRRCMSMDLESVTAQSQLPFQCQETLYPCPNTDGSGMDRA